MQKGLYELFLSCFSSPKRSMPVKECFEIGQREFPERGYNPVRLINVIVGGQDTDTGHTGTTGCLKTCRGVLEYDAVRRGNAEFSGGSDTALRVRFTLADVFGAYQNSERIKTAQHFQDGSDVQARCR